MKNTFKILGENTLVEVMIYEDDKYSVVGDLETKVVHYKGCTGFTVLDGDEGKEYSNKFGADDEHDEYLILHFSDGDHASFRNSHVDLFVLKGMIIKNI